MKKILFLFSILMLVACGKKTMQPEVSEIEEMASTLPNYELFKTIIPQRLSNGDISPTENLTYVIMIDSALPNDSLKLLQNYFIKKGKADFNGINKIIVRAFIKGASDQNTPYALMESVGDINTIIINQNTTKIDEKLEEASSQGKEAEASKDPLVGLYFCSRTHDTYVFYNDNTGIFYVQGGMSNASQFKWERSGSNVTITYDSFGAQKLKFDAKKKTITEQSLSYGTLVYKNE